MKNMKKLNAGQTGYLSELSKGQRAKVLRIENSNNRSLRRRLLDMGLTRGVEVEIKKVSPMGDPIDIYIRNYELCVRLSDLKLIQIEVI